MYCKKCGIRIKEGQEKCPECGTEQDKPEYCGGFWGLVGDQREDEASRQIQKQPEEETFRQIQKQPDTEQDRMYQEQKKELQETKELLKEKQLLKQQCETLKKSCQRQKSHTAVLTGIVVLLAAVCMILTILLLQDARRPDEAVTVKMETEEGTDSGSGFVSEDTETEQQDGYAPSEKQTFPQKQNNQRNQKQNNQKNQKQNSQSRNEQNQNDRKDQEQKSPDKKNGQRNQAETV